MHFNKLTTGFLIALSISSLPIVAKAAPQECNFNCVCVYNKGWFSTKVNYGMYQDTVTGLGGLGKYNYQANTTLYLSVVAGKQTFQFPKVPANQGIKLTGTVANAHAVPDADACQGK